MTLPPLADIPLVDEPYLRGLRDAFGDDRLKALFESLTEEATGCVEEIKKAISAGDHASLRFAAHKLKGMATNLGVPRLGRAARELEVGGAPDAVIPSADALDRILADTTREIRAFR